jgi:Holliday junction resolvasome RuvABC endonuclease subunit
MISLGIDPGGQKGLAWAVYDDEADQLTVGMRKPCESEDPASQAYWFVGGLIHDHCCDVVGLEVQHINRLPESALPKERKKLLGIIYASAASALKLAEIVGACKAAATAYSVPAIDLQPSQIKQAMTGKGNASKADVRQAVADTYAGKTTLIRGPREKHVLRQDEADAAAAAVAAGRMAPKAAPEGVPV